MNTREWNWKKSLIYGVIGIMAVLSAASVTVAVAAIKVNRTRHQARAFLITLSQLPAYKASPADVDRLKTRFGHSLSRVDGTCPASCTVVFEFRNTPLVRLHMAPRIEVAGALTLRNGQVSQIDAALYKSGNELAQLSDFRVSDQSSRTFERRLYGYREFFKLFPETPLMVRAEAYDMETSLLTSFGWGFEEPWPVVPHE